MSLPLLVATLGVVLVALLLGGSAYESIVVAPNWRTKTIETLTAYRLFVHATNPARFFRPIAPAAQLTLLALVIVDWSNGALRRYALVALVSLLVADVITFTVHYPRNRALFLQPLGNAERMTKMAVEWAAWNGVRVALLLVTLLSVLQLVRMS